MDKVSTFDQIKGDVLNFFSSENLSNVFWIIIAIIATIIIGKIVIKIAHKAIDSYEKHTKSDNELTLKFVKKAISIIGWVIVVFACLGEMGVDLTPILASIGAAGVILGFAFQETISNFFSGIMIIMKKPFRVGDYVDLGGVAGTVAELDMMSTELVTPDNKRINLNNKTVWNSAITNFSYVEKRRVDMTVGVAYGSDTQQVKKIISDLLATFPEVLSDPGVTIEVGALSESSVDFVVRPWVATADYWSTFWKFQEQIYIELNKAGVSIPYPQMDVHVINK